LCLFNALKALLTVPQLADVLAECRVLPCSWLLLHACNMLLLPGALHAVLLLPLWQCVSQVVVAVVAAAVAAPFFSVAAYSICVATALSLLASSLVLQQSWQRLSQNS